MNDESLSLERNEVKTMNERDFAYWLKGFFELTEVNNLSVKQVQIIKDHLNLVFNKVTPTRKERHTQTALDKLEEALKEKGVLDDVKICTTPSRFIVDDVSLDTKKYCSQIPTDKELYFGDLPENIESAGTVDYSKKLKLEMGIPSPSSVSKEEMNEAREEAREIRQRLDEQTKGMKGFSKEDNGFIK